MGKDAETSARPVLILRYSQDPAASDRQRRPARNEASELLESEKTNLHECRLIALSPPRMKTSAPRRFLAARKNKPILALLPAVRVFSERLPNPTKQTQFQESPVARMKTQGSAPTAWPLEKTNPFWSPSKENKDIASPPAEYFRNGCRIRQNKPNSGNHRSRA